jgi:hypothetical protein
LEEKEIRVERGQTMVSEADKIVAKSHDAAESRKEREGDRREKATKKNSGGHGAQLQRALEFFSLAFANGHQENCAFAFRVWREETDYVIIVKRKPGGAQVLSVGCKI